MEFDIGGCVVNELAEVVLGSIDVGSLTWAVKNVNSVFIGEHERDG